MKESLSLNGELAEVVLPFTHENVDRALIALMAGRIPVVKFVTLEDIHDPIQNKKA